MKERNENEVIAINKFCIACDDIVEGKFIMLNQKIEDLLKIIKFNPSIKNIIDNAVNAVDFEKEMYDIYQRNQDETENFLPDDLNSIIGVVFQFLTALLNNRINFFQFASDNFHSINQDYAYKSFGQTMVLPFKNAVLQMLESDEEERDSLDESFYVDLNNGVREIIEEVENERKIKRDVKDNLQYILKMLIYSLKYQDLKLILGFLTAFEFALPKSRNLQEMVEDLINEVLAYIQKSKE